MICFLSDYLSTRNNKLVEEGWAALLDQLEMCSQLLSLNGSTAYAAFRAGACQALDLSLNQLGPSVLRYLARSSSSLQSLDLRCNARIERNVLGFPG